MSVSIDAFVMPTLQVGVAASVTLSASGGTAPYSFTLAASATTPNANRDSGINTATPGALPQGLKLSAAGVISGVPVQSGPYRFIVTATDLRGQTGFYEVSGTVARPSSSLMGDATIPIDQGGSTWCRVRVAMKQPGIPQTGRITIELGGQQLALQGGDVLWLPRALVRPYLEEGLVTIIPGAGGTGPYGAMNE